MRILEDTTDCKDDGVIILMSYKEAKALFQLAERGMLAGRTKGYQAHPDAGRPIPPLTKFRPFAKNSPQAKIFNKLYEALPF